MESWCHAIWLWCSDPSVYFACLWSDIGEGVTTTLNRSLTQIHVSITSFDNWHNAFRLLNEHPTWRNERWAVYCHCQRIKMLLVFKLILLLHFYLTETCPHCYPKEYEDVIKYYWFQLVPALYVRPHFLAKEYLILQFFNSIFV